MSEDLIERLCTSIENSESMIMSDLMAFIDGVAERTIPVEGIEKWLRCVHSNGISVDETTALTRGMMESGAVLEWQGEDDVADKHHDRKDYARPLAIPTRAFTLRKQRCRPHHCHQYYQRRGFDQMELFLLVELFLTSTVTTITIVRFLAVRTVATRTGTRTCPTPPRNDDLLVLKRPCALLHIQEENKDSKHQVKLQRVGAREYDDQRHQDFPCDYH